MKFFVATSNGEKYFICHGDSCGLCKTCKAKFSCYTGELPSFFCEQNNKHECFDKYLFYSSMLEYNLFGGVENEVIEYDYSAYHERGSSAKNYIP